MKSLSVIKVGGSLFDWPELPDRLTSYLAQRRHDRLVLVVGGGRVADVVRDLDRIHGLGAERAHHLALRALDLSAHLLAALVPETRLVDSVKDLNAHANDGRISLLVPRTFLTEDELAARDPLPHSWEVTTDSIAARLAERLQAHELVLLKSAPIPEGTDRDQAARLGLVDPAFPSVSRTLDRVTYVNLRESIGPGTPLPRRLDDRTASGGQSDIQIQNSIKI